MLQEKKALLSMRDSGEEVAELMVSYDEIYGTFKPSVPSSPRLTLVFPASLSHLLSPVLPTSGPTEGVVPWLGALIVEFRSIMGLMMSAGEAPQISQGTSGGGQTGEKTLNYERLSCPHARRGKREDNAHGNMLLWHTHTVHTLLEDRERKEMREILLGTNCG